MFEASTAASCSEHVDASKKVPLDSTSRLLWTKHSFSGFNQVLPSGGSILSTRRAASGKIRAVFGDLQLLPFRFFFEKMPLSGLASCGLLDPYRTLHVESW